MIKSCKHCQSEFNIKPSWVLPDGNYCSRECMSEGYKTALIGENNPNFRHGITGTKEWISETSKKWRSKNKEKVSLINRNTKATRKKIEGSHTQKDLDDLLRRQEGGCALCRCSLFANGMHLDHIIPVKARGTNFIGNLQWLCVQCNLRKKTMPAAAYRHWVMGDETEDKAQMSLLMWAADNAIKYPELSMLFHIPNGGYRDKKTAAKMQLMGVKKGVPDLSFPVPRGGFNSLYIELKVGKNTTSPEQNAWISALRSQGNRVEVCYGWQSAAEVLLSYLTQTEMFPLEKVL